MTTKSANLGQWARRRMQRGDVLLEYVILLVFIITPLVLGTNVLFNPAGDYKGEFGAVGNSFHNFYTNLVTGISRPTP